MGRECPTHGEVLEVGTSKTILYLALPGGAEPAREFLEGLPIRDRAKLLSLIRRMAHHGITNREQFEQVEEKSPIYAFKARALRLLCFHDASQLILLVGGGRINRRLREELVERAERLRQQYRQGKVSEIAGRRAG